jgi:hypothetical protein
MPIPITDTLAALPAPQTGRSVTPDQHAFFRAIPKLELHCHLLGAVRHETFADLAARHGAPLTTAEIDAFYARGRKPVGVLHTLRALEQHILLAPEDFHRIVFEYLEDAASENVRHAEFFWNPTPTIATHDLPYAALRDAMVSAMEEAETGLGISSLLIPAIDREAPASAAVAMVEAMVAAPHPRVRASASTIARRSVRLNCSSMPIALPGPTDCARQRMQANSARHGTMLPRPSKGWALIASTMAIRWSTIPSLSRNVSSAACSLPSCRPIPIIFAPCRPNVGGGASHPPHGRDGDGAAPQHR